ncbi:hypothetical protein [Tissierella pigra]|uniref:Uncharacterized protein n=1 Tax=Tissierella pigra TaxID=2607614 RepID=A0A6N7XZ46_9FIRM|nr:hypothetical protein [Tissierella pigra]MSU03107.1 hypothetical protein [Tissierella pigra]
MLDKKIKAYNDNRLVFEGSLNEFIKDNEDDLDLATEVAKLDHQDSIEFNFYHSGNWRIETVK